MKTRIKFNHIGIFTGHHRRLLDFYLPALGFKKEYQALLPKEVMYPIFRIPYECHMVKLVRDDIALEIFWLDDYKLKSAGRWTAGYNHFGLEVKDREKFLKRLKAKFKARIIKVGRGSHFVYFIQDPDGNRIEIKETAKK